jgi:sortase A
VTIRHRPFAAALFAAALFFTGHAAWIPVKAWLGQQLLEQAWQARLAGNEGARPWPWADAYPVAELVIPRLGMRQLVLDGASGRHLAWAPGAVTPIDGRDIILSAHRDTHFAPVANISHGDEIILRNEDRERRYRVAWLDIVDSRYQELVTHGDRDRLTLVTCYPFDASSAGGPLRLVVTALLQESDVATDSGAGTPPSASQSATLSFTTR